MLAVSNRRHTIQKASPSDLPGQAGAEHAITRIINQGWGIMDTGLMNERTQQMIAARSAQGVEGSLPWGDLIQHLGQTVPPMDTMIGKSITQEMAEIGTLKGGLGFNTVDALSIKYAQEQSGQLIRNITESQRATIRMITGKALSGDYTATQAARQIRQGIGLHPAWAQAVINYRGRLEALPAPKGMSAGKWTSTIDGRTDRYQARLVARRASTIARTEIITAENLGRYATWADSIGQGTNSPASRKEWDAGAGACPTCLDLDGTVVPWDQEFPSPGGMMAPAHPNCRCSITLLPPEYQNAALNPRSINFTNVPATEDRVGDYSAGQHLLDTAGEDTGGGLDAADDSAAAAVSPPSTEMKGYTQEQADAIFDYTINSFKLNDDLRAGIESDQTHIIDEAMARAATGKDMTVVRVVNNPDLQQALSSALSNGTEYVDQAFMSTVKGTASAAKREELGELFGQGGQGNELTYLQIRVPAGSRAIDIGKAFENRIGGMGDQKEVLLDRGGVYRVTDGRTMNFGRDADQTRVFKLELVGQRDLQAAEEAAPELSAYERDLQAMQAMAVATRADDLTYESTLHWSDDKLMAAITKYAEDPEAVDKILNIIDQREVIAAQRAAMQQYAESSYKPIIEQTSEALNPAVRAARQLTADQRVEEEYQQYVYNAYDQAMEATNGVFFKKGMADVARAKGVDEISLFTGQYKTASKYASEELQAFWHANGRESLGSYRYKQLGRASDKWYADVVRNNGLDKGTISNDRSQF